MPLATRRPDDHLAELGLGPDSGDVRAASKGDKRSVRSATELVLRTIAIAILLWSAVAFATGGEAKSRVVRQSDLRSALARWTTGSAPHDVHLDLTRVPDGATRAWISAIASSGTRVTWAPRGSLAGVALDVEPIPDPAGRVRIAAAGPTGARMAVSDDLGSLDTITARAGGASIEAAPPIDLATASVGGTIASAGVGDSLLLRHVLVVGRVGWETKFLVRALEERGWRVDLQLAVTPSAKVTQGSASVPLDTGRVAAVLVVGEAVGLFNASALLRYVQQGGGLVLLDGAERGLRMLAVADTAAVAARNPTALGERRRPPPTVSLSPLIDLRSKASVVERRNGAIAVAVRAIGAGRVEQVGYRDTWRWRMMDGDSGIAAHRRWWAARVSDVAYAPAVAAIQPADANPSPLAAWVDRIGPARSGAQRGLASFSTPSLPLLFAVLLTALVLEWWSRRLRGQR